MKQKKFFIAAGAFVLATAAVFAGKTHKIIKKSTAGNTAPALYVSSASGCQTVNSNNLNTHFTTTGSPNGTRATIKSVNGTARKVYWTSNCQESATIKAGVNFIQ